jgi:transposase-like protein
MGWGRVGGWVVSMVEDQHRGLFAGLRFPPAVITVAVRSAMRWYLRYGLSCRDVEELLAERGIAR